MDEVLLRSVEDDLVRWGVLERDGGLHPTRRFRAAMTRAAAELQQEEAAGRTIAGDAVTNVVHRALDAFPLPPDARAERDHRTFLVAVELASLPDEVRRLLGV